MSETRSLTSTEPLDHAREGLTIIIPAYNEEENITCQVEDVRIVMDSQDYPYEILVVDDGSTDRTAAGAIIAKARVLQHPENFGYGASIKTGINAAQYENIVIIDADGTYPPDQIPALLEKLKIADMVVGARTGEFVHFQGLRQPAKWILRLLATQIAGKPIPDLNSGMRSFRREYARQYFPILSNRFSFTTTITLAYLADDYRIIYHPINYYSRVGKSKIVASHFIDFLVLILRMSMMFNPLRIFIPLSLIFGSLGLAKSIYDMLVVFIRSSKPGLSLLIEPVLSTSAVLLLFVGLQFLMIGMVADGVVRRIAQSNRPLKPRLAVEILPEEDKFVNHLEEASGG